MKHKKRKRKKASPSQPLGAKAAPSAPTVLPTSAPAAASSSPETSVEAPKILLSWKSNVLLSVVVVVVVIAGIIAGIVLNQYWITYLGSTIGAIAAVIAGQPRKTWIAALGCTMILVGGILQTYDAFQSELAKTEVQRRICRNLVRAEYLFLGQINLLVLRASAGWAPANVADLLSPRAAHMIASELNIYTPEPTMVLSATRPLIEQIAESNDSYRQALQSALDEGGSALGSSLIRALSDVESSSYLMFAKWRIAEIAADRANKIDHPPLLARGLDNLAEQSFASFLALSKEIEILRQRLRVPRAPVQFDLNESYIRSLLGSGRFGPEKFSQWLTEHPDGAGQVFVGNGDPNAKSTAFRKTAQ